MYKLITFKNKTDEFTFIIFSIIFLIIFHVEFGVYVYNNFYLNSDKVLSKFGEVTILFVFLVAIIWLYAFIYQLVNKDKIIKDKNSIPIVAEEEILDSEIISNEEEFMSFFQGKAFYDFRNIAIENKIISESGKYIYSTTQRHLAVLIGKLYDNRLITDVNRTDFCLVAKKYFQTNIDYSEMNTVINDCLKDELTSKNDKKAFEKLKIFDSIKI